MKPSKARFFLISLSVIVICFLMSAKAEDARKLTQTSRVGALEIKIEGTRAEFTAGTGIGVTGEITNKSDLIVYLNEAFLNLKVPAELEGPYANPSSMWFAYFPTADHGSNWEKEFKATIALQPGDTVTAFWLVNPRVISEELPRINEPPSRQPYDPGSDPPLRERRTFPNRGTSDPPLAPQSVLPPPSETLNTGNQPFFQKRKSYAGPLTALTNVLEEVFTELNFIFFNPGDYKITVTANYWHHPVPPFDDHRIAVQTKTVRVAAPQSVILFGAGIGGLIAYIILPQGRQRLTKSSSPRNLAWTVLKEFGGIIGAVLLSTIVTILLSRISESQFLIRVSIADFWGAIAVGFVSNYLGYEVLKKLIGSGSDENIEAQEKSP